MLENLSKPQPKAGYCKVSALTETLGEDDAQILRAAVDDPTWVAKQLSKALKERGLQLSDTTILRHRRRECICE